MSPSLVIPSLLGYGPMTPKEAWAYVRGELDQQPDTPWTLMGKYLERGVLDWYEELSGYKLERQVELRAPRYPSISGRCDALATTPDGERVLVECKISTANIGEELPPKWMVQGLTYACLCSAMDIPVSRIIFAVVRIHYGPELVEYPVMITPRELSAGAFLCEMAQTFYDQYVATGKPPDDWNPWAWQQLYLELMGTVTVQKLEDAEKVGGEHVVPAGLDILPLLRELARLDVELERLRRLEKEYDKLLDTIAASVEVPEDAGSRILIDGGKYGKVRIVYYNRRKLDFNRVPPDAYTQIKARRVEFLR